jgi:hypothetical protein
MSLIDWSDPEEMLGLLVEYVADERAVAEDHEERAQFLGELSREINAVAEVGPQSAHTIERMLREIHDAQPREFVNDPVMAHVEACIEELHRIGTVGSRASVTET